MGGSVNIAVRNGDIRTFSFSKQTLHSLAEPGFFEGSHAFWDGWKDGDTECCAPIDYGLVAIDYVTQWIGNIQNYTCLDCIYQDGWGAKSASDDRQEMLIKMRALWDNSQIIGIWNNVIPRHAIPVETNDFDAWIASVDKYATKLRRNTVPIQVGLPAGWSMSAYKNDEFGWRHFANDLVTRGWNLNPQDILAWEAYAKSRDLPCNIIAAGQSRQDQQKLESSTSATRKAVVAQSRRI